MFDSATSDFPCLIVQCVCSKKVWLPTYLACAVLSICKALLGSAVHAGPLNLEVLYCSPTALLAKEDLLTQNVQPKYGQQHCYSFIDASSSAAGDRLPPRGRAFFVVQPTVAAWRR
jgi:hypothetical protein